MPEYVKILNITDENIKKTGDVASLAIELPESLPWFAGHFPGHPVLPAVIITEISDALIEFIHGLEPQFVSTAKFKGPVSPDTGILITVSKSGGETVSVTWQLSADPDPEHFLADLKFRI